MTALRRTEPLTIHSKASDGPQGLIAGYASTFGNVDRQDEAIAAGAFRDSLAALKQRGGKLPMLSHHDAQQPVGSWHALAEDQRGLFVEGKVADTAAGRDAFALARNGALGLSIGFKPKSHAIGRDSVTVWTAVELLEVSLVAVPANPEAQIHSVKSLDDVHSLPELEALIATAFRCSNRRAKQVASTLWPKLTDGVTDDSAAEKQLDQLLAQLSRATETLRGQASWILKNSRNSSPTSLTPTRSALRASHSALTASTTSCARMLAKSPR